MSRKTSLLDRLCSRRMRLLWLNAAREAETSDLDRVRELRSQARADQKALSRVLHVAEGRLALPRLGSNAMHRPPGADWMWRPELWRGPVTPSGTAGVEPRTTFGEELVVHHDCPLKELTLRQHRNDRQGDLAPFGVAVDILGFEGSYLSLLIQLPEKAAQTLARRHIFRVELSVERDRDIALYGRLNVKNGPNTEQITTRFEGQDHALIADFDLGFSHINEKRVERLWLEVFFESPAMSRVDLRDLTVSRRHRAEV